MKSTSGWWSPRLNTSSRDPAQRRTDLGLGDLAPGHTAPAGRPPGRRTARSRCPAAPRPARAVTRSAPSGLARKPPIRRGHRELCQLLPDHGLGQEVGRDELGQRRADGVLAGRDDRGVRDRQSQRMPEQRGDGEPVGQRADHAGLRGRPDVAEPGIAVLQQPGDHEDHRHQPQQARWRRSSSGPGRAAGPRPSATARRCRSPARSSAGPRTALVHPSALLRFGVRMRVPAIRSLTAGSSPHCPGPVARVVRWTACPWSAGSARSPRRSSPRCPPWPSEPARSTWGRASRTPTGRRPCCARPSRRSPTASTSTRPAPASPSCGPRSHEARKRDRGQDFDPDTEVLVTVGRDRGDRGGGDRAVRGRRRGAHARAALRLVPGRGRDGRRPPRLGRRCGRTAGGRFALDPAALAAAVEPAHPDDPAELAAQPDRHRADPRGADRRSPSWRSSATCSWSPTRCTST